MAIIFKQNISEHLKLGIWEISSMPLGEMPENLFLDEKEKNEIRLLKNESRKKEILCTKLLIHTLLGSEENILYDNYGKPYLKNSNTHLSISHSHKYVAAIIDKKNPTGIDIQKITPKIFRIKEKFLGKKEMENVSGKKNLLEILHVYWGAKECIFKEHGKGNLIFSDHIYIEPFCYEVSGEFRGFLLLKNQKKQFILNYKKYNEYMLVYIRELVNIVT